MVYLTHATIVLAHKFSGNILELLGLVAPHRNVEFKAINFHRRAEELA